MGVTGDGWGYCTRVGHGSTLGESGTPEGSFDLVCGECRVSIVHLGRSGSDFFLF